MHTFEIFWDDLTDEAKERLEDLYHDNISLSPLAIIEVEDEEELEDNISSLMFGVDNNQ